MKNKKKQIIITLVAIISLIVITVGVTYAFFNYAKEGTILYKQELLHFCILK